MHDYERFAVPSTPGLMTIVASGSIANTLAMTASPERVLKVLVVEP